jgi:hypothetical protein
VALVVAVAVAVVPFLGIVPLVLGWVAARRERRPGELRPGRSAPVAGALGALNLVGWTVAVVVLRSYFAVATPMVGECVISAALVAEARGAEPTPGTRITEGAPVRFEHEVPIVPKLVEALLVGEYNLGVGASKGSRVVLHVVRARHVDAGGVVDARGGEIPVDALGHGS